MWQDCVQWLVSSVQSIGGALCDILWLCFRNLEVINSALDDGEWSRGWHSRLYIQIPWKSEFRIPLKQYSYVFLKTMHSYNKKRSNKKQTIFSMNFLVVPYATFSQALQCRFWQDPLLFLENCLVGVHFCSSWRTLAWFCLFSIVSLISSAIFVPSSVLPSTG